MPIKSTAVRLILLLLPTFNAFAQTANITEGCLPLTVNFTAPTGPSTFFWDFKDGATSILQNPSNTFTTAGTYVVEFKETSSGPIVGTVTITVHPKLDPQLVATSPTSGCTPLNVSIEANVALPGSVSITSYNWTFGDGGAGSGQNVNHFYNTAGVYDVSVELVTNMPSCDITTIFNDYVSLSNPPTAFFITNPNPALACTGPLTVSFTNGSSSSLPVTYDWDFGNGNVSTNQSPAPETYTTNGIYPVELTVTDTNDCSATFTQNVTIGNPLASFDVPDTFCLGSQHTFINNSSAGLYSWNFGPNISPSSSTLPNPTVNFPVAGSFNVTLTVTSYSGLCSSDTTITVVVEDPQISFTSNPTYSCYMPVDITFTPTTNVNVATWEWIFGDDSTSADPNPVHTYDLWDSTYSVHKDTILETWVIITSTNGCIDSVSGVDTLHLPWARFQPDVNKGCAPLSVTFSDSSRSGSPIVSWEWHFGDGTTVVAPNGNPVSHVYSDTGEFDVILIIENTNGCIDTSYHITIFVGEAVTLDFIADQTSICPGGSITFTNQTANGGNVDAWHYSTSAELVSHCFHEDDPTFVFDNHTGFMDITFTAEQNGCYSSVTKSNYIEVKGPIAHFNHIQDCSLPYDVVFVDSSEDATSVTWDLGDGTTETSLSFIHTYATAGDYTVILTATNASSGCPDWSDTSVIYIRDIQAVFPTDSLICGNTELLYDASASVGVHAECYRGYTWVYSDTSLRPYTTENAMDSLNFAGESGPQTISLIVEDINGCFDTLTHHVVVFNIASEFTMDKTTFCTPGTINFTDISTSDTTIVDWSWNFDDGNSSTVQSPSHTYTANAPYYLPGLIVTDAVGCASTFIDSIPLYKPVSNVSTNPFPANVCLGDNVVFNATDYTAQGSFLNYVWDFDDGSGALTNNVSHTYTNPGNYTVSLVYTENSSGCMDSTTVAVNVQDYPLAGFITDTDTLNVLCYPQIINFSDTSYATSPVTYTQWNFGNGIYSYNPNASFTFNKGIHDVTLIAGTSFGCRDTITRTFEVVGPEGDFTLVPNTICKGESIEFTITDTVDVSSYLWDFGDGSSQANVSPIDHIYTFIPPSGQTVAKLTVYGPGGICPVTVEQNVYLHEVRAGFDRNDEFDTTACLGESILFTNTSMNSDIFSWTLGDGTTSSSGSTFNHVYPDTGTFSVTLFVESNTLGCKDTLTKDVIVHPLPEVTAVGDSACYEDSVFLSVLNYNPTIDYIWSPTDSLNNPNIHNPSAYTLQNTVFTVTATDTNGCVNTSSAMVVIIPPLMDYVWDTTIVVGDTAWLPANNYGGTVLFQWVPDTGLSCLTCNNPWVQPLQDVSYTLYMTDIFGCSSATAYLDVYVLPETHIDLPTTFTPNGDGVNDIIYVEGWGIKDLLYFRIYNRWGELVFESNDINIGWDGYYKGMLQNNDIYVYKVMVNTWLEEELQQEGHINLMR